MDGASDVGVLVGMTVSLSWLDAEQAIDELARLGFAGIEVHVDQLRPALGGVPALEAHAAAIGALLRERGLVVSSLNGAGSPGFEPVAGDAGTSADLLAVQLRLASALGAPRLICWDGRPGDQPLDDAPARLAAAIAEGRRRSGLSDPPAVSVELHPFTFALATGRLAETAVALAGADAGVCVDFCHFAVALGPEFADALGPEVLAATNHVHLADSDGVSSEVHFPLGEGALDVDGLTRLFAGREVCLAWDMFGWPAARRAMEAGIDRYRRLVQAHEGTFPA